MKLVSLIFLSFGLGNIAFAVDLKSFEKEGAKVLKNLEIPRKLKNMEKKSPHRDEERVSADDGIEVGMGLQLGSGATYGNGVVTNIDFRKIFRAQAGVGYNSTGPKAGIGGAAVLPISLLFGFDVGAAYGHSFGTKDQVSLQGRFTPEGSSQKESVEAIRKYRISPGNYYSFFVGGYFAVMKRVWIDAHVIYNKFVSGHEVEFYDTVSFDKPIEAINEDSMQSDFEKKARAKLNATGPGFSLGIQLRI